MKGRGFPLLKRKKKATSVAKAKLKYSWSHAKSTQIRERLKSQSEN